MTYKEALIKELGEDRAKQFLSERAREMRSKVKNPYKFTSETAKEAINKRWAKDEDKKS